RIGSVSPCIVFRAVERRALALGVYVKDVLPTPGCRIGIVLIGAQSPVGVAGHRIDRNAAQEAQLLALHIHTVDQSLHIWWISKAVDFCLKSTAIGSVFVTIDGVAHLPQITAKLDLLLALNADAHDGNRSCSHNPYDREGHD